MASRVRNKRPIGDSESETEASRVEGHNEGGSMSSPKRLKPNRYVGVPSRSGNYF